MSVTQAAASLSLSPRGVRHALSSGRLRGHYAALWAADPAGARQMIAGMMPGLHASRTLSALAAVPVSSLSCPLLGQYAQSHPELVAMAMGGGPPPDLFPGVGGTGGLPKATASGIDPGLLATLPWQCRRPLAAEPDRAKVLAGIELYSDRGYGADMAAMDYARDPARTRRIPMQ